MTGTVAGAIKTDLKPRQRKSLAERVAALDKRAARIAKRIERDLATRDKLADKRNALIEQAKRQRVELDAVIS